METIESEENKYVIHRPSRLMPEGLTSNILASSSAYEFHTSLPNYAPTPLISLKELARKHLVCNIFIKDESSRFGLKSFKTLGASYALSEALRKNPLSHTFCTATEGNHGHAVAWSAKLLNKKVKV